MDTSTTFTPLVHTEHLGKCYPIQSRGNEERTEARVINDVSISIDPGITLGLVGESGCGKSTLGKLLAQIIFPTSGTIWVKGKPILPSESASVRFAQQHIQMIFQDPYESLNPRMPIQKSLREPLKINTQLKASSLQDRMIQLLNQVGLDPSSLQKYPHEFSGGQRQRICIARSLALEPELIICDEAVSALDVSVQAQILNLLQDIKQQLHITYLFISHDLGVVHHIADKIAVMYLGSIIEYSLTDDLFKTPRHPYTKRLLDAIPKLRKEPLPLSQLTKRSVSEIPSPSHIPPGCPYHPRCSKAQAQCTTHCPPLEQINKNQAVACWYPY